MGKRLYVGNLSFSLNDDSLRQAFTEAGEVESAKVITDRDSGRSKGFGFVEMKTDEAAANAIKILDGRDLGGRQIRVSEARPIEKREGGGGGGGGGRRPPRGGGGGGFRH